MNSTYTPDNSQVIEAFAPPRGWCVLPASVVCDPGLTPEARCVLMGISAHYSDDGGAWPSLARLGAYLGRSRSTVLRALADLEERGLVRREHRFRHGQQQTTRYVLTFERWGGVSGDTPKSKGGVTHDTPRGVTDAPPRGVTGDTQPIPENKTQEQNHPLTPATGGGTDSVGWVQVEARTRAERADLARLLEGSLGTCRGCSGLLAPSIVQHATGARTVSVRPSGTGWRHLWCHDTDDDTTTEDVQQATASDDDYAQRFYAALGEENQRLVDEWRATGVRPRAAKALWATYLRDLK